MLENRGGTDTGRGNQAKIWEEERALECRGGGVGSDPGQ